MCKSILKTILPQLRVNPQVVFSVSPAKIKSFKLYCILEGVAYVERLGCWEGEIEPSFTMAQRNYADSAIETLFTYDQQAVLELEGYSDERKATLRWLKDGRTEPVGYWQAVPQAVAFEQPGWTLDTRTGEYFATLPERPQANG